MASSPPTTGVVRLGGTSDVDRSEGALSNPESHMFGLPVVGGGGHDPITFGVMFRTYGSRSHAYRVRRRSFSPGQAREDSVTFGVARGTCGSLSHAYRAWRRCFSPGQGRKDAITYNFDLLIFGSLCHGMLGCVHVYWRASRVVIGFGVIVVLYGSSDCGCLFSHDKLVNGHTPQQSGDAPHYLPSRGWG
jgi:hypothetical protein